MKRLVTLGNHYDASRPFVHLFNRHVILNKDYKNLEEAKLNSNDVLLLCGGEDISPSTYNQRPSRHTGQGGRMSERDVFEMHAMSIAKEVGASILGICRGAQLLCAFSGGSLFQHVNNHSGRSHTITTNDNKVISVSSAHHQMMNPFSTKHELIAWASVVMSDVHLVEDEKNLKVEVEPEIVFFHELKGLALQYHPEFMADNSEGVKYSIELVKKYLL